MTTTTTNGSASATDDASPADAALPTPTLNQVREQLPPEIRNLVDQMEKSWKEGLQDGEVGNPTNKNNNNKPAPRQRKNTPRNNSATTKSLAVLFQDFLHTEAGQTLIQDFPDDLLQKTGKVVYVSQVIPRFFALVNSDLFWNRVFFAP